MKSIILAFTITLCSFVNAAETPKQLMFLGDSITQSGTGVEAIGRQPDIVAINAGKSGRNAK